MPETTVLIRGGTVVGAEGLTRLDVALRGERVVALGPDLFLIREPHSRTWTPVTFYQLRTGEKYVHFVGRATPLVT